MPRSRILTRLEPTREPAPLAEVLAARLADPLWMLARQWQFGELLGELGGTPVSAKLECAVHPLTHLRPGPAPDGWPDAPDPDFNRRAPLDPQVEAVADPEPWPLVRAAEAGQALLESLDDPALTDVPGLLLDAYELPRPAEHDPEALALRQVLARRLPDGARLARDLAAIDRTLPDWPLPPGLAGAAAPQVLRGVLEAWWGWCAATTPAAPFAPAWQPDRLTHAFALAAATSERTHVFTAPDHAGRDLDWLSFDVASARPGQAWAAPPTVQRAEVRPAPLRFAGMPLERWWETGDAAVDLGAVDAGAADLARLLVLEFALGYGGDSYTVPLRLPFGCFAVLTSLVVTDTFGARFLVPPAAERDWDLFTLAPPPGEEAVPGLLLVSAAASPVRGDATEELNLMRDELANLAWAVEDRWEGGTGCPVDRPSPLPPASGARPADPDVGLSWRLADDPPPQWLPLLPDADDDLGPVLRRLDLAERPLHGRLAAELPDLLTDRLIPGGGRRLQRRAVLAFDPDGHPMLWVRRERSAGGGEGSSGLAWDRVEVHPPVPPSA